MSISYDSGRYGRGIHPPYCTCVACNEGRRQVTEHIPPLPPQPPNQGNRKKRGGFNIGCIFSIAVILPVLLVSTYLYFQGRLPIPNFQKPAETNQVVKNTVPTLTPTLTFTPTIVPTSTPIPTATLVPTPMPTQTQTPSEKFALLEDQFKQWRSDWLLELGELPHVVEGQYNSVTTINLPVCGIIDVNTLFELETSEYIHLGNQEIVLYGEHKLLGKTNKPGLAIKVQLIELDLPTLAPWKSSNTEYISELKQFLSKCDDKNINQEYIGHINPDN